MKLGTLSLKGVLRFHDPVTLNFRELPSGLIAVVGPNGAGKTCIMDSPFGAIYRHFPSRDGELVDYATRTDAYIETSFDLEGRGIFRARVNLDGPHRKAEAVLLKVGDAPGGAFLNDGKLSTYDAAVATILPPMSDLLASVFAAQNRNGAFSALDRKGKRELFASLLGLDHIEALADLAGQAVTRLRLEVDRLTARREILDRSVTAEIESSLEQRVQQLQSTAGAVDVRRVELQRIVTAGEQLLADYRQAVDLHARALSDARELDAESRSKATVRDGIVTALRRLDAEHTQQLTRLHATLESATARYQADEQDTSGYDTELRTIETRRKIVVDDATKRIAANEGLQKDAEAIRAAVSSIAVIDAALALNAEKATSGANVLQGYQRRERVLFDAMRVIEQKEADLTRAERDAAAIDAAPFGEQCAPCAFMANAAAAKAQIAGLRDAVAARDATVTELSTVQRMIDEATAAGQTLVGEREALQADRAAKAPKAHLAAPLALAEARIHEREREIAAATSAAERERAEAAHRRDQRILRLRADQANRKDEHAGAVTVLTESTEKRRTELTASSEAMTQDLLRITDALLEAQDRVALHAEPAGKAERQEHHLARYRREWDETTETRARVAAQIEGHAREVATFAYFKQERDGVVSRLTGVQVDLIEWQVLAKALGREGLQTLEIDNAGPVVSAFANDLLHACYGGRFTLELVTQAPKVTKGKDGSTHKEVFEANVYDQARGGEKRDLSDLSGGERVIVEEVLRSAISLLVSQRSSFPMRTLWRDECTGALDSENAPRYVAMLRRIVALGGYHQVLMVTHSAEVAQMADVQIRVADGGLTIAYPPYSKQEAA